MKRLGWLAIVAGSFFFLHHSVILRLVRDWYTDENYSHGFLIVPLSVYFAWERRLRLKEAVQRPSLFGLALILGSQGLLLAGILGSELFLTRVSMLGTLAGAILFLYGWNHLRILIFPIAFLILMIPIPAIIFNQIAFPLQLFASRFGETVLQIFQVPALREGNVIILANTSLEVAEACSGIRSLISLLALAIIYGYFIDPRIAVRLVLVAGAIPIAIVANGIRVAGTGIVAHFYGAQASQGFFHGFSGWIIFLVAFIMMFILYSTIAWISPNPKASRAETE